MDLKKLTEAASIQTELLHDLLAVFERETVEMGDVNVAAMADSNIAKEDLLKKISEHAPVLKQAISDVAVREGLGANTSLGALAEVLWKKGNRDVLATQQQIKSVAEKVQQAAGLNREIAERFNSTVTTTLTLITRLVNQSNVYGASGGYQPSRTGAVIINMEA